MEYKLVINDEYQPIYHTDGSILIERISDGHQFYVDPDVIQIEPVSGSELMASGHSQPTPSDNSTSMISSGDHDQRHWTRNEILHLISEYKNHRDSFASTTIKNGKVWQKIAEKIGNHNALQCENKFKYLKTKYIKKIDNMSSKSSGASQYTFEYFEELNEIFAKQPIVNPIIASSSRDTDMEVVTGENTNNESASQSPSSPADRPTKNMRLKTVINDLNKILETSEQNKERRHNEIIRTHQDSLNTFKNLLEKFLEKM